MRRPAPLAPLGLAVAAGALAGVACAMLAPALPPVAIAWTLVFIGMAALVRGTRGWRLAGAFALGVGWACVAGQARLAQRLEHAAIEARLGVVALEDRFLSQPLRQVAHQPRERLREVGERQHPRLRHVL